MEMFLMRKSKQIKISTARFANVAFSDGSLLHGFNQRIQKGQPIAAPNDIKRYFVTPQESGELCLMSTPDPPGHPAPGLQRVIVCFVLLP